MIIFTFCKYIHMIDVPGQVSLYSKQLMPRVNPKGYYVANKSPIVIKV